MKKGRAMKETKESLNVLVIFAIVLLCFSAVATACPPPQCNPCYTWNGERCVWDCSTGQTCCGGSCCSNECCNDTCCNPGDNCCNNSCCSNECCNNVCCPSGYDCCDGLTCYNPATTKCCNEGTGHTCPTGTICCEGDCCYPELSEVCCDGTCEIECTEEEYGNCNEIEDIPCPGCFNLPSYCNNHETEISTNAPIYNCTGGGGSVARSDLRN